MTADEILRITDPTTLMGADPVKAYRELARQWHPDRCQNPRAAEVMAYLEVLREAAIAGVNTRHLDPPTIELAQATLRFGRGKLTIAAPDGGLQGYKGLHLAAGVFPDLRRRLPTPGEADTDNVAEYARIQGMIPLTSIHAHFNGEIPQRHVAWICARLYELIMELATHLKVINGGLTWASCAVLPADHGVIPLDWRFARPIGAKMTSAPGELVALVPSDKKAAALFDLRSVGHLGICLLGDPSGVGNKLLLKNKAALHPQFLSWFREEPSADPVQHYRRYRQRLQECFGPPKFHKLEI